MASFDINSTDSDIVNHFKAEVHGKIILITGPSKSGIGAQVAIALASAVPKLLILAGRNIGKITPVIDEIKSVNSEVEVKFVELDLLNNASIRKAVQEIKASAGKIDVLINNAGVMASREFALSADRVESQFAVNYLGHFLLTNLLIKQEVVISGSRVVNVGSLGYQMADIDFDDINFKNGQTYNGWKAYGQAKSAQLLGIRALVNQLKSHNITVLIAHPGVTLESKLLANSTIDQEYFGEAYALAIERNDGKPLPPQNMVTLRQAAGVVLYTALTPELKNILEATGAFIVENKIYKETRAYANNDVDAARLWTMSEALVGEQFRF